MAEHPINGLMETTMSNIKEMVDVNTIVGAPVTAPDGSIILPISKVSFGFGAAGSDFGDRAQKNPDSNANFGGGSGGGALIEPVAFLVMSQGQVRLMPVERNNSPVEELIERVPGMIEKVSDFFKKRSKKKSKKEEIVIAETVSAE
ncbi:MAG: sporulation protein YtfJ [Ruminococcaceae bacterium]|nr:sporulation protein YtfJ [Oscillospiraceae bacterium]